MNVNFAVLHKVDKKSGKTDIKVTLAKKLLPVNDTVKRVVDDVRKLYTGSAVYGVFQDNENEYRFQKILNENNETNFQDFHAFSSDAMKILEHRMKLTSASAGGYVLFVLYEEAGVAFLFVLMLNDTVGAHVKGDLTLEDTMHLDMSKLYVAGRVNISKWQACMKEGDTEKKYVSFIRRRRDIANYFVDFIGCTEVVQAKDSTIKFIGVFQSYIESIKLKSEEKEQKRSVVSMYLEECHKENKEASLEQISTLLDEENPESFTEYASNEKHEIGALFPVHKPSLVRLRGVVFKGDGLNIRMSQKYVRNHVHITDKGIEIRNAPDELIKEIQSLT